MDDGGEVFHTISSSREATRDVSSGSVATWGRERSLIALSEDDKASLG